MTKGNPLKLMLQFAFPLLIGNLLQQTYNIIDAAIVGQILGAKALATIGASSSIQISGTGLCMGSCTVRVPCKVFWCRQAGSDEKLCF